MTTPQSSEFIRAQSVKEKYSDHLLSLPGVHAVMTTIVDGKPTILVLSNRPSLIFPTSAEGVPIRRMLIGRAKPLTTTQVRPLQTTETPYEIRARDVMHRPAPGGVTISSSALSDPSDTGAPTLGTLGLVVFKGNDAYILSNHHVIAMMRTRNELLRPIGSSIFQPTQWFAETSEIAKLSGRPPAEKALSEWLDFAWAKAIDKSLVSGHIRGFRSLGTTRYLENSVTEPNVGAVVGKSGRSTANTIGVVVSTDANAIIELPEGPRVVGRDQIIVGNTGNKEFSIAGDSGSAVIAADGSFIGLPHSAFLDSNGKVLFVIVVKTKYIVQYMGTGFYFVQHVPTIIDEPSIPGLPVEIPKNLSPGSANPLSPVVVSLTPTLSWSSVQEASAYLVMIFKNYVKYPDGTFDAESVYTCHSTINTASIQSGVLEPSITYGWRVSAQGSNGVTDLSPFMFFKTTPVTRNFTLTISVSPPGSGTTSPPVGTSTREAGSTVPMEAFAKPGYEFVDWKITSGGATQTYPYPRGELNIQADTQAVANFRQVEAPPPTTCSLQILLHSEWQGYTNPARGTYTKNFGDRVTITAYPYSGYLFDYWGLSDGTTSKSPVLDFTITQDIVVTANFKSSTPGVWSLTMRVLPSGAGTTQPPLGSHAYPDGELVTIDAFPNPGYAFDYWRLPDGSTSAQKRVENIKMDRNYEPTAHFVTAPVVKHSLTALVSPTGVGTVSPSSGSYNKGSVILIQAVANYGYEFSHWSGDASGSEPAISVTMDADKNVVANFKAGKLNLSASVAPAGSGSVSPASGIYDKGSRVLVTATPVQGYIFDHWSGDASGSDPSIHVDMNADRNVTANFRAATEQTYILSVTIGGSGSVSPLGGTFGEGEVVQVVAVPHTGWKLESWAGTDNNAVNPTYVTMDRDKSIIANFVEEARDGRATIPNLTLMITSMMMLAMMTMVSKMGEGIEGGE